MQERLTCGKWNSLFAQGYGTLCGVDEAGAGPLAKAPAKWADLCPGGPPHSTTQQITPLHGTGRGYHPEGLVGLAAEPEEIDANILQARMLAMERAIQGLSIPPDLALIDGNRSQGITAPNQTVVKGDSKSASIAAASILAKVCRDRHMVEMDRQYPQYGFAQHKGYPTKLHYERLRQYGPCPNHRRTF